MLNHVAVLYVQATLDSFRSVPTVWGVDLLNVSLGIFPHLRPCLEHICAGGGGGRL